MLALDDGPASIAPSMPTVALVPPVAIRVDAHAARSDAEIRLSGCNRRDERRNG
jgi:hypothetical protein